MQETPFDAVIETLGLRERLKQKRQEQAERLTAMSLEELVEAYCPQNINPYEWPLPWPREALGDRADDFWRERRKLQSQWDVKLIDSQVTDTSKRLRSPNHCICGCKEITGDHIECWISGNYAMGHPDHGRVVPCRCRQVADRGRLRDWLLLVSGLKALGPHVPSFGHWNTERFPEAELLQKAFIGWSQDTNPTNWLFVYGPPGTGKTHLCQAATLAVVGRQKRAVYIDVLEFIAQGRYKLGSEGNEFSEWILSIKKAPYLVIDDIGQEYATDWTASVMREILHWRYMNALPTIVCSNRPPNQLVRSLGEATVDRFTDKQICTTIEIKEATSQRPMLGAGD